MTKLPIITFAIVVLNEEKRIEKCLEGIIKQKYPKNKIEILVVDGGSTDKTIEIAKLYQAKIIHNPAKLAEPGLALAYLQARGDYMVFMAADNILFDEEWLSKMLEPLFQNPSKTVVAFSKAMNDPKDNIWNKYLNQDQDPFSAFVFGKSSHPSKFGQQYPVIESNENYVIYDYDIRCFPLIALAQCTILKTKILKSKNFEYDDILPLIKLIKEGKQIAFVKNTGILHYSVRNFGHFVTKFNQRIYNSMKTSSFRKRDEYCLWSRKIKKYLFLFYSFSLILPLLHSFFLMFKYKKIHMFLQLPASLILSYLTIKNLCKIHIWEKLN